MDRWVGFSRQCRSLTANDAIMRKVFALVAATLFSPRCVYADRDHEQR